MTSLDQILPSFQHREQHNRWIDAPPQAVWHALHSVGFDELSVMRLGLALRGLPARLLGRAAPAPSGQFLAGFKARGYTVLAQEPGREVVTGSIARPWKPAGAERTTVAERAQFVAFTDPGWAKVAADFRIEPEHGGTRISTETRVLGTDAKARRAFAAYWIVIRVPSGLIRRDLLRAIARRAEREGSRTEPPRSRDTWRWAF